MRGSGLRPVPAAAAAVDRLLYRSALVAVGAWRCPRDHPLFGDSGPIRNHCVTFPRTAAVIQHAGGEPCLADATVVELYNAGQEYRRLPVSPLGAQCDYFAFAPDLLRAAVRFHDPARADTASRLFALQQVAGSAGLYLRQRQVFRAVESGEPDPLWIEERVVALLDAVLGAAYGQRPCADREGSARRRAALADRARRVLAEHLADRLPLADLAEKLSCSPFHLCRAFRERTGRTLHGYRVQLRLRTALERLEDGADVTTVALEVGFSSHSHITAAFRAAFGVTPTRFARLGRRARGLFRARSGPGRSPGS